MVENHVLIKVTVVVDLKNVHVVAANRISGFGSLILQSAR
jgi:hypothetical protein